MLRPNSQILTVAQMRAAEDALIAGGISFDELMQCAGRGAAEWVWRLAARRPVTVLCGPGNNGGDGYVIAEALRERGGEVRIVAPVEPKTVAAQTARQLYRGEISAAPLQGEVLVDCLFGSGLTRRLSDDDAALLGQLAASHHHRIAIDLPSGVESDSGGTLNEGLPGYDLTIALGAWKYAHWLMPACAGMGALRLVDIGVAEVAGAASVLHRPALRLPEPSAHKYLRGLLGVVGGAMPGAAVLAAIAAQRAGAGYVKLLLGGSGAGASTGSGRTGLGPDLNPTSVRPEPVEGPALSVPPDLVADWQPLTDTLADHRIAALLIGPGLGRDAVAHERLAAVLSADIPTVLDADALMLLEPEMLAERSQPLIVTPHAGELRQLEAAFGLTGNATKPKQAAALAQAGNMVVVAKGPDTVIAAPDGRIVSAPRALSWLSVAGTGDVLAGTIASRLAAGADPFAAACEGVWLHGEAARLLGPAFTASALADAIGDAYAAAL